MNTSENSLKPIIERSSTPEQVDLEQKVSFICVYDGDNTSLNEERIVNAPHDGVFYNPATGECVDFIVEMNDKGELQRSLFFLNGGSLSGSDMLNGWDISSTEQGQCVSVRNTDEAIHLLTQIWGKDMVQFILPSEFIDKSVRRQWHYAVDEEAYRRFALYFEGVPLLVNSGQAEELCLFTFVQREDGSLFPKLVQYPHSQQEGPHIVLPVSHGLTERAISSWSCSVLSYYPV